MMFPTKATAFALLAFSSTVLAASPARYVFTFGDSYTTTGFDITSTQPAIGNQFGNPAYPGKTTDNGANWVNVMVKELSPANTLSYNFAVYAATINNSIATWGTGIRDFKEQVALFEQHMVPAKAAAPWNATNSIFASYFGTNDVNIKWKSMPSDPSILDSMMDTYFTQLSLLYAAGARRFMVFILDPLMRTPLWSTLPQFAFTGTGRNDVTAWNSNLTARIADFKAAHPDAKVAAVDTQKVFNDILNDPKAYGAPNNLCNNTDGVSCLWYDKVHPGQAIQKSLGQAAHAVATNLGFYNGY